MIEMKTQVTGARKLDAFSPELGRMVRRVGPYLFERIKARARQAKTSDEHATAPLSKKGVRIKKAVGARPIRDYSKTKQTLNGLAISFLPGRGKNGARLKVWFRGARSDALGRRTSFRNKSGALKRKTNQRTANLASLVGPTGRPMSENYPSKPYHAFVEPSPADLQWLNRELDKEIGRALRKIPLARA